ncbi:hypothetical protein [Agrobacterium rosae]|uniref:hypothetical protein n=1 Tax=Agrobacterium rosae TaxID=1972867 RepID=UPI00122F572E|nr:hypothetical protein [Agrobacterium rosae]KAA3511617.1 hypothetical protein DXM21_14330 [Agrobacterium rosae]KAA3518959.1 hypothetical protein DXM25_13685 [Agrobacterium rosae]MQB49314.1 hypothetical protein [Agrobacterium rosae]
MTDLISTDWKELDADNTSPSPNGVQGGYSPSQVAPVVRAIRGSLKRFYNQSNAIYTSTGTGAAYVLTFQAAPSGYSKGIIYRFWSHISNTGAATLNINTLGAKAIVSPIDGSALTAGQIASGKMVEVVYNGTAFELLTDMKQDSKLSGNTVLSGSLSVSGAINADQNVNVKGQLYVGTSGSFLGGDGNILFTGGMASQGSNLGEALNRKANLASPTFTGTLNLPSVSETSFKQGTGDGASYTTYNTVMKGWWGMGMATYDNTVQGYYDFRAGRWNTKGGTYRDGVEYVLPNGANHNISVLGSAASVYDAGNVNAQRMVFNWNGQPGQPSWLWGGVDGKNMYVYQPANLSVMNSAQLGGLAASDYATKADLTAISNAFQSGNQTYTAQGLGSVTHGLGRKPNWYICEMVCTTASNGWSVGETFDQASAMQPWTNTGTFGILLWANATTINWKIAAGGIAIIDKSNGNSAIASTANWQLRFRAGF